MEITGLVGFVVSRLDPTLVTNKLSANLPSAYTAFVQTSGKDVFGICSLELRDEAICLTCILYQSIKEKMEMRAKIIVLVRELDSPKSADELLTTFEGRESELLKNLIKMKAKKEEEATISEIKLLIEELNVPKSADEVLSAYKGRVEVLLKNLKKLKSMRCV